MEFKQDGYRNTTVTVGTTVTTLADARNRVSFYVKNISTTAQVITVWFDDKAVAVASGGGYVLNVNENAQDCDGAGYSCWRGAITAVSSAAGGTVTIAERESE